MEVIELRYAPALMLPDLQGLLKRAVESNALMTPHGFDSIAKDIFSFVTEPKNFMLLGIEKGRYRSLMLGFEPNSMMFPYPTVVLIYNEGSKALLDATRKKAMDMLLAKGYTKLMAVNSTKRSARTASADKRHDALYKRLMKLPGVKIDVVGSLVTYEIE